MTAEDRLANQMEIWKAMQAERIRAHEKHKAKPGGSMEDRHFQDPEWTDVLMEELGEISRAINDFRHGLIDMPELRLQVSKEAVQLGAMAGALVAAVAEDAIQAMED